MLDATRIGSVEKCKNIHTIVSNLYLIATGSRHLYNGSRLFLINGEGTFTQYNVPISSSTTVWNAAYLHKIVIGFCWVDVASFIASNSSFTLLNMRLLGSGMLYHYCFVSNA